MERRRDTRFELTFPALVFVEPGAGGRPRSLELQTRDLSATGAYFLSAEPLPPDTPVEVALIVRSGALAPALAPGGAHISYIRLRGRVVRREAAGFAAAFRRRVQILPLEEALERLHRQLLWMRRNSWHQQLPVELALVS